MSESFEICSTNMINFFLLMFLLFKGKGHHIRTSEQLPGWV